MSLLPFNFNHFVSHFVWKLDAALTARTGPVLQSLSVICVSVAHLAAMGGDDTEVSRDPVSSFHLHQVSCHHLLSVDLHLLSFTDHQCLLGAERENVCVCE